MSVESNGEGTSSGVQPTRERMSPTRASSSSTPQVVAGRIVSIPDLLIRCWVPPGELSCRFLTLNTTLELVYDPVTCTHVSLLFL